jgi:hypothetical protein
MYYECGHTYLSMVMILTANKSVAHNESTAMCRKIRGVMIVSRGIVMKLTMILYLSVISGAVSFFANRKKIMLLCTSFNCQTH